MTSAYGLTERCTNPRTSRPDDVNNTLPDASFAKRDDVTHKDTDNGRHTAATNTLKNLEHVSRQLFSTGTAKTLAWQCIHAQQLVGKYLARDRSTDNPRRK